MYRWLKRFRTAREAVSEISASSTSPDFVPAESPNASPLRSHVCAECGRKRRNPISVRGGRARFLPEKAISASPPNPLWRGRA